MINRPSQRDKICTCLCIYIHGCTVLSITMKRSCVILQHMNRSLNPVQDATLPRSRDSPCLHQWGLQSENPPKLSHPDRAHHAGAPGLTPYAVHLSRLSRAASCQVRRRRQRARPLHGEAQSLLPQGVLHNWGFVTLLKIQIKTAPEAHPFAD